MNYAEDPKVCTRGCREKYKETDEDHHYAYHTPKTVALLCGCGYGDIFVSRMRKHLLEAHDLRITKMDVVNQFFWHRLPVYNAIRKCDDMQRLGCVYRTPIHELIENGHDCKSSMRKSKLPKQGKFIDYMQEARVVPVHGVPNLARQKSRSPSPKRSMQPSAKQESEPESKVSASSVSGRRGSKTSTTTMPSAAKRHPSASPMRTSATKPSRFESRRPEKDEDESSESEFSGSEHSADTRPEGTRKPSSVYQDEMYELELHARGELSDFEVEVEDEKRTVKPSSAAKSSDEPMNKPSASTADERGAIGYQLEKIKQMEAEEKAKTKEKWQTVDRRGKGFAEDKSSRANFEPNWDVLERVRIPMPEVNASSYAARANLMREPSAFVMRGLVCYNTVRERTQNVYVYFEEYVEQGQYVLICEDGNPFCYATITPHAGNPWVQDKRWAQFNPMNYPCYAEMSDRRTKPNQIMYYAAFSVTVATGKFHMLSLPLNKKQRPYPVSFHRSGDFGQPLYVKYKET